MRAAVFHPARGASTTAWMWPGTSEIQRVLIGRAVTGPDVR